MPPMKLPAQSVETVMAAVIKANIEASILAGTTYINITDIGRTLIEIQFALPTRKSPMLKLKSVAPIFWFHLFTLTNYNIVTTICTTREKKISFQTYVCLKKPMKNEVPMMMPID